MPKQKTHSASSKRFKVTGSGKFVRSRGHKQHKATPKSSRQKRNLRGTTVAHSGDERRIAEAIPYAKKNR